MSTRLNCIIREVLRYRHPSSRPKSLICQSWHFFTFPLGCDSTEKEPVIPRPRTRSAGKIASPFRVFHLLLMVRQLLKQVKEGFRLLSSR
jgi:hypothetical protein